MSRRGFAATIGSAAMVVATLIPLLAAPNYGYSSPAYDRGCAEMSRHDWDGAIISFGETIGFDMNNKDAYFRRGQCFYHLNNYKDALTDFSHLLEMAPRDVNAHLWRGTVHSKMGQDEAAVKDYLAAIRLDPTLAQKYDAGNGDAAAQTAADAPGAPASGSVANYARAMTLYHEEGRNNKVPGGIGVLPPAGESGETVHSSGGSIDTSGAVKRVKIEKNPAAKFTTFNPPSGSQSSNLSPSAMRVEELDDAIRMEPTNWQLFYKRGRAYRAEGNDDRALADFTEAVRLNPEDWRSFMERARIYNAHNEPDLRDIDIKHARNANPRLPRRIKFVDDDDASKVSN